MKKCTPKQSKLCGRDTCQMCFNRSFASNPRSVYWSVKNDKPAISCFRASDKEYLFVCNVCNHEFSKALSSISSSNKWCPHCGGQRLCNDDACIICYDKSFAATDKSRFWSQKNVMTPRQCFRSTATVCIFDCNICGHEFSASLNTITNNDSWCSFCGGKKLCDDDNCDTCFNKSFSPHIKSKYWSDRNTVSPRQCFKSSNDKFWFKCDCGHEFCAELNKITGLNSWCPYCSSPPQELCNDEECASCFDKSFAKIEKSQYWSKKNVKRPRECLKASNKKYWFDCILCKHEFFMALSSISSNGQWCQFCSNQQLCDNEECVTCLNKSFASTERSKYWSKKNIKNPRQCFKSSRSKYLFDCDKCGHEFAASLDNITGKNRWCSHCVNKTECKLLTQLKQDYNVETQKRFDWCRNNATGLSLPFDFVIPEYKIIIELDGAQHFRQVAKWKSPNEQQRIDHYKMDKAILYGYTIIRILQEDVFENKYDWWTELQKHIHVHSKPTRIYLCKNNEYDCYILEKEKIIEITDDDTRTINDFLDSL